MHQAEYDMPLDFRGGNIQYEFRRLLSGELDKLPEYALFTAAEYEDGSDEAFLRRLWHQIYGDEPVQPVAPA
jgi:hypothetical protein